MRVMSVESAPVAEVPYRASRTGGGVTHQTLPVLRGRVDVLPKTLEALVLTSDLQGIADGDGGAALLGVVLAPILADLGRRAALPPPERTGVLLAGDLCSTPAADARGASGDARPVWLAFRRFFRWVVGVAGNHDNFGDEPRADAAFAASSGAHVLDGDVVERDNLQIGGIGGSVGDPRKPRRKSSRDFARMVRKMKLSELDILLLHGGPDVPSEGLAGSADVRGALDRSGPVLVVCGQPHWPTCTADVRGGAQVLNVDGRAVVLTR